MTEHPLPKISMADDIRRRIETHCFSAVDHEVGGFLVGGTEDGVTTIRGAIASTKAKSEQANLTFTHEAWDEAYAVLHEKFPDESLVGWYHSHPGYKVFLSEYDAFIQHNFFAAPGHVALVIDPLAAEAGWFVSRGGEIVTVSKEPTKLDALRPANRDEDGKPKGVVLSSSPSRGSNLSWPTAAVAVFLAAVVAATIGFVAGNGAGKDSMRTEMLQGRFVALTSAQYQLALTDPQAFASNFGVTIQTIQLLNPYWVLNGQVRLPYGTANVWPVETPAPDTSTVSGETSTAGTETPTATPSPTKSATAKPTATPSPTKSATAKPTTSPAPSKSATASPSPTKSTGLTPGSLLPTKKPTASKGATT